MDGGKRHTVQVSIFEIWGDIANIMEGERINGIHIELGNMFEVERKAVMDEGNFFLRQVQCEVSSMCQQ